MSLYSLLLPYVLLGASIFSGCKTLNQFDLVATHDTNDPRIYRKVHLGNKRVEIDASGKDFEDYGRHFLIEEGKEENVLYMDGFELSKLKKDSRIVVKPVAQGIVVYVDDKEIDTSKCKLEEIVSSD
jgi:hypothetical protein